MAKINGSDIANELAASKGLSKTIAKEYADFIFAAIKSHVENGDEVNISSFGKFKMHVTAPRKGRNIHTQERIDIPAKHKLVFEMSRLLQQKYNSSEGDRVFDISDQDDPDGES